MVNVKCKCKCKYCFITTGPGLTEMLVLFAGSLPVSDSFQETYDSAISAYDCDKEKSRHNATPAASNGTLPRVWSGRWVHLSAARYTYSCMYREQQQDTHTAVCIGNSSKSCIQLTAASDTASICIG